MMKQNPLELTNSLLLPRPSQLYQPHTVDANDIEPEQRFDVLSHNLAPYAIEIINNRRPDEIIAIHSTISGAQGDFCSALGSANQTRFDPHQTATRSLFISLLLQGNMELIGNKRTKHTRVVAGTLALYERDKPVHYHCDQVQQLYLLLPYAEARVALGGSLNELAVPLDAHPLAPFLRSQMLLLHTHAMRLTPQAIASVLDGLHSMSLLILADIGKELGYKAVTLKNLLYTSAKHYLEQHYSQRTLTPDVIASALCCSRSSLDRACAEQGTSIMKLIQDVRLNAARDRLESHINERIDTIAYLCGFSNSIVFSKLYKARFAMSPKAWREAFMVRTRT